MKKVLGTLLLCMVHLGLSAMTDPKINVSQESLPSLTTAWRAFDGNTNTFPDMEILSSFVVDFYEKAEISGIRFFPRPNLLDRIRNGVFQGSDDGIDWTTLYTVPNDMAGGWNEVSLTESVSYRYIRFYKPYSLGNFCELEFYGVSPTLPDPLPGKLSISSDQVIVSLSPPLDSPPAMAACLDHAKRAFDGEITTSPDCRNLAPAVDFGKKQSVQMFRYHPRSLSNASRLDSFSFEGSDDSNTWYTVFTRPKPEQIFLSHPTNAWYRVILDAPVQYRYYRIANVTWGNIAEIELYEPPKDDSALSIFGEPFAYGVVSPAYGITNQLNEGDTFLCSAPETVKTDEARYVCKGSILESDGAGTVTNTNTSFTYVHSGRSTVLTWIWENSAYLLVSQANDPTLGNVTATEADLDGYYSIGKTVTLSATPTSSFSQFLYWTGDIPDGVETNREISLTMDRAKKVVAVFGTTETPLAVRPFSTTPTNMAYDAYLAFDGSMTTRPFPMGNTRSLNLGFDAGFPVHPDLIRIMPIFNDPYHTTLKNGFLEASNLSETNGYETLFTFTEEPAKDRSFLLSFTNTTHRYRWYRFSNINVSAFYEIELYTKNLSVVCDRMVTWAEENTNAPVQNASLTGQIPFSASGDATVWLMLSDRDCDTDWTAWGQHGGKRVRIGTFSSGQSFTYTLPEMPPRGVYYTRLYAETATEKAWSAQTRAFSSLDTRLSGTVTASHDNFLHAVDGNLEWVAADCPFEVDQWIQLDLGAENTKRITTFRFWPRGTNWELERRIIGSRIEGSDDATSWVTLGGIYQFPQYGEMNELCINAPRPYRYVRLVNLQWGGGNFREIELRGANLPAPRGLFLLLQ